MGWVGQTILSLNSHKNLKKSKNHKMALKLKKHRNLNQSYSAGETSSTTLTMTAVKAPNPPINIQAIFFILSFFVISSLKTLLYMRIGKKNCNEDPAIAPMRFSRTANLGTKKAIMLINNTISIRTYSLLTNLPKSISFFLGSALFL